MFYKAIRESTALLKAQAVAGGQDVANAAAYGNYAIFNTPVEDIYGENLPRLKSIKKHMIHIMWWVLREGSSCE